MHDIENCLLTQIEQYQAKHRAKSDFSFLSRQYAIEIMSLDLGMKKIGVAILDSEIPVARPHDPLVFMQAKTSGRFVARGNNRRNTNTRRGKNEKTALNCASQKHYTEHTKHGCDIINDKSKTNNINTWPLNDIAQIISSRGEKLFGVVIGQVSFTHFSNGTSVTQFLSSLSKIKPIAVYDERFTTRMADNLLKLSGMKREQRNAIDDSVAASIILNDFYQQFIAQT